MTFRFSSSRVFDVQISMLVQNYKTNCPATLSKDMASSRNGAIVLWIMNGNLDKSHAHLLIIMVK